MSPQANPTLITVPTSAGTVTVNVPWMDNTLDVDWRGVHAAVQAIRTNNKNAELRAGFDAKVSAYNVMMGSGSFPVISGGVPVGPPSYVFVPADPNDPQSEPGYEQTGPPITSTIPLATVNNALIKIDTTPGQFQIGSPIPGTDGKIFQGLKDTNVEGTVKDILGPNGLMIKIRKHNVPWGGYWEVIG